MPNLAYNYVAGLVDGEGTIVITKPTPSEPRKHQLRLAVCMTNRTIIEDLHFQFGGNFKEVDAKRWWPNAKPRFDWVVSASSAGKILQLLLPYLRVKKEAAEVAIKFQETMGVRGVRITEATFALRESLRLRLKKVNSG